MAWCVAVGRDALHGCRDCSSSWQRMPLQGVLLKLKTPVPGVAAACSWKGTPATPVQQAPSPHL